MPIVLESGMLNLMKIDIVQCCKLQCNQEFIWFFVNNEYAYDARSSLLYVINKV